MLNSSKLCCRHLFSLSKRFTAHSAKTPKVLVFVADGSEEIETMTPIDVLRRAEADVTVAKV